MCGIAGYVGTGSREILQKMTESLRHRGPDDAGYYIDHQAGLGFRRLSIIDVQGGHQPLFNEDKSVVVIFNGEIYNYSRLRDMLIQQGHVFLTQSDTEVIVHLYEEKGEKIFEYFNGMFALAIWDTKKKILLLGKDRMGKKPLYYGIFQNTIIFGSELKSLILHPLAKREINWDSFNKYLTYEYVPTPHTIFKNIFKLPPAHYLAYKDQAYTIKKYWEIDFKSKISAKGGLASGRRNQKSRIDEHIIELDGLLDDAVKIRLISDVPLGVFLSGGIDSSTVAYYAQRNTQKKIQTFSMAFEDKSFDESSHARNVADFLGTQHHEATVAPRDLLDTIPRLSSLIDEPYADSSIIPTYLLSQFTRKHVTVALGGDGGDELLLGYPTFQAEKIYQIIQKFPKFFQNLLRSAARHLPTSFNNISFDFKVKKLVSGFSFSDELRHQIWLGSFYPNQRESLLSENVLSSIEQGLLFEDVYDVLRGRDELSRMEKINLLYLRQYLLDDILVKVDRASMYASLEVRAPFLDYRIVDFTLSLFEKEKLKGFRTKYILKKLMKGKLPDSIIRRSKKGFGVPIAKWFRSELKDYVIDMLSESTIKRQGIFQYPYIHSLLKDHFSGAQDNRKYLWVLLAWQMWYEKYGT